MSAVTNTNAVVRRRHTRPIPPEGESGLYTQTWHPVCLSAELPPGGVVGANLLGGRVIAFRGAGGKAYVLSAYCVHVGADLGVGRVIEDRIRCAFHGWEYDGSGVCQATGSGDPVPPSARLYRFPTVEKYGIVWAFNGDTPLFELPHTDITNVTQMAMRFDHELAVDPWVISAQTLDLQHFALPHEGKFVEDPNDSVTWDEYSVGYRYHARMPTGDVYKVWASIHGTNIFWQVGELNGGPFHWITGIAQPAPGRSASFFSWGTPTRHWPTPEAAETFLNEVRHFMMNLLVEDAPVLTTIHYQPGVLTESDRALSRFFEYLRRFPRDNPAREFLH